MSKVVRVSGNDIIFWLGFLAASLTILTFGIYCVNANLPIMIAP